MAKHRKPKQQQQSSQQQQPQKGKPVQAKKKLQTGTFNLRRAQKNATALSTFDILEKKMETAKFRFINEKLYTTTSKQAQDMYKSDPSLFEAYQTGYKEAMKDWPFDPIEHLSKFFANKKRDLVVADFGCGEARLAAAIQQTNVHCFDFVAKNERVTACDMAHTPLSNSSVDVAVFCLSLMGTNLFQFLEEAHRVLKPG